MKITFSIAAIMVVALLSGCHTFHQNSPGGQHPAQTAPVKNNAVDMAGQHAQTEAVKLNKPNIVTPDTSLLAKVVAANDVGRFVIVGFPNNQVPKLQQSLFLYRAGLKVAEVKVTGPQSDNNIVADLVSGDAKVGDTVRAE
jgi:uncharacterized protein YceK